MDCNGSPMPTFYLNPLLSTSLPMSMLLHPYERLEPVLASMKDVKG